DLFTDIRPRILWIAQCIYRCTRFDSDTVFLARYRPLHPPLQVSSGTAVTFREVVMVAADATQDATIHCTVRFLMNGTPGGDTFVQSIAVTVNQMGCFICVPEPGQNVCHPTTSCVPTPFGTICLTRPRYKADGAADDVGLDEDIEVLQPRRP